MFAIGSRTVTDRRGLVMCRANCGARSIYLWLYLFGGMVALGGSAVACVRV
jgi:hypothetical protein